MKGNQEGETWVQIYNKSTNLKSQYSTHYAYNSSENSREHRNNYVNIVKGCHMSLTSILIAKKTAANDIEKTRYQSAKE